ncbi:uncharacterized protein [Asterias amurensis]|uniref:uncharacterized protein n=1 Tax=Asterias amurensis TaxID=7602 RepID=UPI003AB56717
MAVLYPCLNFGAATLLVTVAWVFFGRNLSFGTLSVVMYFPTLVALLFMAVNNDGEFWQFFSRTIGGHHFLQPDKVTNFSVVSACWIAIAFTILLITLCALLSVSMGWGHLTKQQKDQRSSEVKQLMIRRKIWGFLRVAGEEIGWRCYLLPCLMESFTPSQALAVSGVIWGLFHVPIMILLTGRINIDRRWTTVIIQCIAVFLSAFPHGWIAIRSGYALWPSAVMHYSWNILNPFVLGSIYTNTPGLVKGDQWLVNGEGLAGCLVSIPVAVLIIMNLST